MKARRARLARALLVLGILTGCRRQDPGSTDLPKVPLVLSSKGAEGRLSLICDGKLAPEGSPSTSPMAIRLASPDSDVTLDMGKRVVISRMLIQADADDHYALDASDDGSIWRQLWLARALDPVATPGLRTREAELAVPTPARYIRVRGVGGDLSFAVSEVRLDLLRLADEEPRIRLPKLPLRATLDNETMVLWKMGAALLAAGLLALGRLKARPVAVPRDVLLALLALFSCAAYFNLGRFHFDRVLHYWEHFHYFLGAKYARELQYTRLYPCVVASEIDRGNPHAATGRRVRNLVTNELEKLTGPGDPRFDECRSRFTPARWKQFQEDVTYFRSRESSGRWIEMQQDHGYNGTPVWAVTARPFVLSGASERVVFRNGLLDPLLLTLMWSFVLWAFGWRATCVAMIWWGTNYPARYWWNGGAFLRMDWLALSTMAVCFLKKGKLRAGGFALTWAALLRIFPGFLAFGLLARAGWECWRRKRVTLGPEHRAIVIGALVALGTLVPLSAAVAGLEAWPNFVANSRKHVDTPLTNNVGLGTLVAFEPQSRGAVISHDGLDPWGIWKEATRRKLHERRWVRLGAVLLLLGLVARAARGLPDWAAVALSTALVPALSDLTSYYYSVFLVMGLLAAVRPSIGAWLALLSAATCWVHFQLTWDDERYTTISALVLAFCVGASLLLGREPVPALLPEPVAGPAEGPELADHDDVARKGARRRRRGKR